MNNPAVILSGDINLSAKLEILRLKTMAFIMKLLNAMNISNPPENSEKPPATEICIFNYKGFVFYYNNDGIRADLMKSGDWSYDEETTSSIITELTKSDAPIFLDIGSHAGFITLNVLANIPHARVFAFEPGMLQGSLFEKTIEANNLKEKVTFYKEAPGHETGTTSFINQESPDVDWSLNNGFLDTGRGLDRQKHIIVTVVQTIDNWWNSTGRTQVNVVKIYTESAEPWILQGGTKLLSTCKPTIFLEINPLNLHVYPYDARDILKWFDEHDYYVKTIDMEPVTREKLKHFLKTNELFVAHPRVRD